jgi:ABC-2 type transport system ATP-binding protein
VTVEVAGLSHRYGDRTALSDVSFGVRQGEIFGLVGPNGGGKTTLFKILSTILPISTGTARIAGVDVRDPSVRRKIGVVFQSPSLDKKLKARENLLHHGHLYGLRGRELRDRIGDTLGKIGLQDRAEDLVETLSGGMQRRVEIAKALLPRPEVLLLDEPSTGLDPGARRDLWDVLRSRGGDVTILLTTHLLEEAERCDRLAILHKGKLVAMGTPQALREEIGGEVVTLRTPEPGPLAEAVRTRFGLPADVSEGTVRLSRDRGHELVAALMEAFGPRIESVTVARPSLEDVFLSKTREAWS